MKYVSSNGGPLVAVPAEWAKSWCGSEPTRETTDYDRACGKLRAFHQSSYGGVGLLRVGKGDALVFDAPTDTTFVALPDGGAFLRNVRFSTARAARAALASAPKWKTTRAEIVLKGGRIFVFDAAYPHPSAMKGELGRPDILTAKLERGRYRVLACDWHPEGAGDYELRAYRLARVR